MLGDVDCCNRTRKPCSLTLRNAKHGNADGDNRQQTSSKPAPQPVLPREIGTGLKCVLGRLEITLSNSLFYFSVIEDLNLGFSYMIDKHPFTELFRDPFIAFLNSRKSLTTWHISVLNLLETPGQSYMWCFGFSLLHSWNVTSIIPKPGWRYFIWTQKCPILHLI